MTAKRKLPTALTYLLTAKRKLATAKRNLATAKRKLLTTKSQAVAYPFACFPTLKPS